MTFNKFDPIIIMLNLKSQRWKTKFNMLRIKWSSKILILILKVFIDSIASQYIWAELGN